MMIRVFFLAFFGLLALSAAQSAQICTSTSLNFTLSMNDSQLLVYTANLQTKDLMGNPKTQLFVTNEAFNSANSSLYYLLTDGIRVSVGGNYFTRCHSIGGYCSWLVGNDTVEVQLPIRLRQFTDYPSLIDDVVDEGGISLLTGELFTEDNNCREMINNESGYTFYARQCCTAYKSVPPPPMNTPKCMAFNSSTTFYKSGKFLANINATFDVVNDGFMISTSSKGSDEMRYILDQNTVSYGCSASFGSNSTCTSSLPKSDLKIFFPLTLYQSFQSSSGPYIMNTGRLIRRNGVYEMEEGAAFTKESPCSWQSATYDNNTASAVAQFCCMKFADN